MDDGLHAEPGGGHLHGLRQPGRPDLGLDLPDQGALGRGRRRQSLETVPWDLLLRQQGLAGDLGAAERHRHRLHLPRGRGARRQPHAGRPEGDRDLPGRGPAAALRAERAGRRDAPDALPDADAGSDPFGDPDAVAQTHTLANLVTGSRALLAIPAFVFALRPETFGWLAVTVSVAALTDLVDGTLARRFGGPSRFGAGLDPVVDGVFFGAVALGLAVGGAYPFWLAAVVAVRYFGPALVGLGLILLRRLPDLRHTFFGQLSTALIAVLVGGVALLRGLGLPTSSIVLAGSLLIPLATLLAWVELGRAAVSLQRPR
ncbi:MAG: CDP-alcohol phosphatidyltransferase family protein [Chloroflexi bacterium]|nr:MAG: CDP-alcohol phosphatidyltransferase family protein [Chloroflexota bacterium]